MLRLFRFLWTGSWHEHEWETIKEGKWASDVGDRGNYYDIRCKHCGWIKSRSV